MGFGFSGGVARIYDERSLPTEGKPNSRMDLYKNGKLVQSRWFGPDGKAAHDRDYSDHSNPKEHPNVPHDHEWDWTKDIPRQEDIPPDWNWN